MPLQPFCFLTWPYTFLPALFLLTLLILLVLWMWLVWEACSTTSPPISGYVPSQALHGILAPRFAFLFFSIHFLFMTINSTDYNFFTHCRIIFTYKVQNRLVCFQKSGEIWWCAWIEEGAGSWRYQRSSKSCFILRLGPSRCSIGSECRALLLSSLGRWTLCQAYCKGEARHGWGLHSSSTIRWLLPFGTGHWNHSSISVDCDQVLRF